MKIENFNDAEELISTIKRLEDVKVKFINDVYTASQSDVWGHNMILSDLAYELNTLIEKRFSEKIAPYIKEFESLD